MSALAALPPLNASAIIMAEARENCAANLTRRGYPEEAGAFERGDRDGAWAMRFEIMRTYPRPGDFVTTALRLLAEIRLRNRMLSAEIAQGPAFPMLLELAEAARIGAHISVTSLCLASYAPDSTGLRHIGLLTSAGLIERIPDPADRRRVWLELTEIGAAMIGGYLIALEAA